jgi:hypothetical protein
MKPIQAKFALVLAALLASSSGLASTWNTFAEAFNEETALFFFDADTVLKQGDSVTLWVKYVNTKKPDSDGSWSTAQRTLIVCSKRTQQILSSSIYDKDGNFIRSFSEPGKVRDIAPDSIIEGIHQAACAADFPRNKSKKLYFPVDDNDIYQHTRRYLEYRESQRDKAPQ